MVPRVHHTGEYLWTWHVSFSLSFMPDFFFFCPLIPWKIPVLSSPGRGWIGMKALRHRSHWADIFFFFTKVEITASPL